MKTQVFYPVVICIIITITTSCTKNDDSKIIKDPIPIVLSASENKIAVSDKSFAINLFSTVCKNDSDNENIMISPFSLSSALAMVWNGTDALTKTSIQNTLGFEGYSDSEVNGYFKKLRESLIATDPSLKLAIANSIWYRKGAKINDVFSQTNKNSYNAHIQGIDFSSPSTASTINNWCSNNTNGLINNVAKEISPDALLCLINALYFKGEWKSGYDFDKKETIEGAFTCDNGKTVTAQMMNNVKAINFLEDPTLSAITLPYGNGAFDMVIILPKPDISINQVIDTLNKGSYWANMSKEWRLAIVKMQIPRFKFKFEIELNNTLRSMGMSNAFDALTANFSKAFIDKNFYISLVKQFTYIDLNEKGTEAAAISLITAVSSPGLPKSVNFTANHPFIFAIKENSTGCILFIGKVGNPV